MCSMFNVNTLHGQMQSHVQSDISWYYCSIVKSYGVFVCVVTDRVHVYCVCM